jgi:hypothetical protein
MHNSRYTYGIQLTRYDPMLLAVYYIETVPYGVSADLPAVI